jgi:hypothetical protein
MHTSCLDLPQYILYAGIFPACEYVFVRGSPACKGCVSHMERDKRRKLPGKGWRVVSGAAPYFTSFTCFAGTDASSSAKPAPTPNATTIREREELDSRHPKKLAPRRPASATAALLNASGSEDSHRGPYQLASSVVQAHLRMSGGKARGKQPRDTTAEDALQQLQTLHHTHREATRLFLIAVREGATDA